MSVLSISLGYQQKRGERRKRVFLKNHCKIYRDNNHQSLYKKIKLYLRNRKHVPCFYRVIQTRVEVWENEKCCGNTSRRWVFPQLFRVLPNFNECLYNSIETRSTCFLFLLENNAMRKRKTTCKLWLLKCKFFLFTSSLRQQCTLVLCLHRVIQTRYLTNQCACFLRTVF